MTADTSDFYLNLPVLDSFFQASRVANYRKLPADWYVAVTDIVNSTRATDDGRYKTVNILGASPIIGILNVVDLSAVPYVFGGDGAAICFPPALLEQAREVLGASRRIGKEAYGLDLRAAVIPVSYLDARGKPVKVARYRVSEVYIQSVFTGGGLSLAEEVLKDRHLTQFQVALSENPGTVDFSGLECRWKEVRPSDENKVITLLVKHNPGRPGGEEVYGRVMEKMQDIFGFDDETNPISVPGLSLHSSLSELMGEIQFRTFGQNWLQRLRYLLEVQFRIAAGRMLMALNCETSATDWSRYKTDLALNTDHRKFDDMLRVVISGSDRQAAQMQDYLEKEFRASALAYGLNISDAAMITCMVNRFHQDHIHFVDGSGGGYVKASKGLKRRMKEL